ncbi:glucose-6-phosphate isomerase [Babesia microti strain RI]|uniref:Glucose-6-phosphate isomerase n=1 Tax=Babesia microti (strain RI) TaxID=1133968 RepID=A0A1N6LXY4_BABMR|nr:glucose-6-phosphate isomerase [Babesia microti strain RI]SIO73727.1 glucose-6-phosphate isomerase [Babesia microti strain RI]|eukprot:XP_021337793.1 glucose-6-phosphate isomerase [Babesia microti strain RI]
MGSATDDLASISQSLFPFLNAISTLSLESKKLPHLSVLLKEESRCNFLIKQWNDVLTLDLSRQKLDQRCYKLLLEIADSMQLGKKIANMFSGFPINGSEKRPVLHMALRSDKEDNYQIDGTGVYEQIKSVLDRIESFSEKIRLGEYKSSSGKIFDSLICVGIGGSFLGTSFVTDALYGDMNCKNASFGRKIRFLSNIDPADFIIATSDLNPETTMIIIISKTFTTVETMMNANACVEWLKNNLENPDDYALHLAAVSSNLELTAKFGIPKTRVFGFWNWVGGRYSVTSSVGILPLAINFGFNNILQFLKGCRDMDLHFKTAPFEENLPVLMGLCSVYNSSILGISNVAILPYSQNLSKFPSHVQQLTMESNGKGVDINANKLPYQSGEFFFGEPGTNGQHSFYQLLHQGRRCASEFIGVINSIHAGNLQKHHMELMANFFAQPDALAIGMDYDQIVANGVDPEIAKHKVCPGDRPCQVLLMKDLSPYTVGTLLSLYEHRTAVEGFLWNINSFDQMGVELGKVLAKNISDFLKNERELTHVSFGTKRLIDKFLKK